MSTQIDAAAPLELFDLLHQVEQGQSFTITVEGVAVAQITPVSGVPYPQVEIDEAVEGLIHFPRVQGVDGQTVLEWIHEGRE